MWAVTPTLVLPTEEQLGSWCWKVYQRHEAGMREPSTACGVSLEAPIPSAGPRCAAFVSPLVVLVCVGKNLYSGASRVSLLSAEPAAGGGQGAVNWMV